MSAPVERLQLGMVMTMMKRGCLLCAVFLGGTLSGTAGVGTWNNFTSMKDVKSTARAGQTYWAATSGGLFSWKEGSTAYQMFTNAEGLKSIDLTAVNVDSRGDVWAGSSTGVIHLYSPQNGTLLVIPDIANASQPNKRINSFAMYGDTVLICTEFGLSVFRIGRSEFGDTYSKFGTLPTNARITVYAAALHDRNIWACVTDGQTNNGVAVASLSNPNLLPPESWTVQTVGSPTTVPTSLTVFQGQLYTGTTSGMYTSNGVSWSPVAALAGKNIVGVASSDSLLTLCTTSNEVYTIDRFSTVTLVTPALPFTPTSLTTSTAGAPVVGSLAGGLLTLETSWTSHAPNGPNSNLFNSVAVDPDGAVWGGSGSSSGQGVYRFRDGTWTSFTTQNSALRSNDIYRVSAGCNASVWASSYGAGIAEIPRGSNTIDSAHVFGRNVGMVGVPVNFDYIAVSTVVCDSRGNHWMSIINPANKNVLTVRRGDGVWVNMPAMINSVKLSLLMEKEVDRCLAVDASDNIWATVRDAAYKGVVVLPNPRVIDSTGINVSSDNHITAANGLPSDDVKTIIVDRDNTVWVGTDRGIGIILDPDRPKRPGGIAAYKPLNGLVINTLAVDPLNQKWVGTNEGVVLLSPDGTQQLASYTVENTQGKLIDNDVKSIAVDERTGTVYFGTTSGLASLTTAAAAPKVDFEELTVYPNPYRIPNPVPLTIDGLVQNSGVRILTIDGQLVRDLKTPGGRIGFWDGKDQRGNDVATGIYVVVGYSEDGTKVANGKVAVIRR